MIFYLSTLLGLSSAFLFPLLPLFPLIPPELDPFYWAPSNLDSLANGEVYDSRPVFNTFSIEEIFTTVEQIAYKTVNTQNESSYSVATVFTPFILSPEPAILSYQIYEDAANLDCSPSYHLVNDIFGEAGDIKVSILTALKKGWHVIVPDHEGARSAFLAGHEQAYAGLDGIRAGINHLCLDKQTPVAMLGYSGGASATVWMESLQSGYAPELNIVGSAHGGTPVDIESMLRYIDSDCNLYSAFMVPALAGLLSAYPDYSNQVWSYLRPELVNAIDSTREPGVCLKQNILEFQHQAWGDLVDTEVFDFPGTQEIFQNESLLANVSAMAVPVPTFPRYIWHATGDEVTPIGPVDQYVQEQCSEGANIQYVRWGGDDHVTAEYLGLPDALRFIIDAIEGCTPPVQCGTPGDNILTLIAEDLADCLSQPVADMIAAFNWVTTPLGQLIPDYTNGYEPCDAF